MQLGLMGVSMLGSMFVMKWAFKQLDPNKDARAKVTFDGWQPCSAACVSDHAVGSCFSPVDQRVCQLAGESTEE